MTGIQVVNGRLKLDGVDVGEAADRFGTPMFIYAGDSIETGVHDLKSALGDQVEVYYSIKANPSVAICSLIRESGVDGAEIASSGELIAALHSGFEPSTIIFAGPGKTDEELAHAVQSKVGQINIESVNELNRVNTIAGSLGVAQPIGIRVNPETDASGLGKIRTGGGAQKFGIDESKVVHAIKLAHQLEHVEFAGLHTMLGSQVLDAEAMLGSCKNALDMAARIGAEAQVQIPSLNFGGGLGVSHKDDDPKFDLHRFGTRLTGLIQGAKQDPVLSDLRCMIEPGRVLVSAHGLYVSRVIDVKESVGQNFAILDGGIHQALLPITANTYRIVIASRADHNGQSPVSLGGPLCTSADQWRSEVLLPDVQVGDVIAMYNSGAYGLTASMNMFLSRGTPIELLVRGGSCSVIRERWSPESVLDGQIIP